MTKILSWLVATITVVTLLATGFYLLQLIDLQEFTRLRKIDELDNSIAQLDFSPELRKLADLSAEANRKIENISDKTTQDLKKTEAKLLAEKLALERLNARSMTQRLLAGDLSVESIVQEKHDLYLVRGHLSLVQQAIAISEEVEANRNSINDMYERQLRLQAEYTQHSEAYNKKGQNRKPEEYEKLRRELGAYNAARKIYVARRDGNAIKKRSISFSEQLAAEASHELKNDLNVIRDELTKVSANAFAKTVMGIRDNLWKAIGTLFSAFLGFIGLKIFNYYVLSGLARKGTPLTLPPSGAEGSAEVERSIPACTKSEEITLSSGQTLYARGRYIKSEPGSTGAEFKAVLDWTCPMTCLSAGLVALTVYNSTSNGPVVLVPRESAVGSLLRLQVSGREELCLAARNLVAIITTDGTSPRFRKIWKLGSAHSWLSWQFRYLLVSGPCEVILEGSHSLIATSVTDSRQVESGSAVAFSGQLAVGAERTSSFGAYLFGTRPLFEEVYTGRNGVLVHQHVIHIDGYRAADRGGFMKSTLDVLLKLVGI